MLSLLHFRHCCHHDRRIILLCEKNGMKNKTFYYKRNIITTQTDRCSCSADVVTCSCSADVVTCSCSADVVTCSCSADVVTCVFI